VPYGSGSTGSGRKDIVCEEQDSTVPAVSEEMGIPVREFNISDQPEYVRNTPGHPFPVLILVNTEEENFVFERIISSDG
jgi:hypothetical protein